MNAVNLPVQKQRNRNYEDTHELLIDKAGELILESGADGVSVSALARVTGVNRSTIYYHFDSREALMSAALKRSGEQLSKAAAGGQVSRWVGIGHISDFFQTNPEVVASWIDNHVAAGDLRERYPQWDSLVAQLGEAYAELTVDEPCDAEVYCALVLTSAFMVPRPFANAVHPFEGMERILERIHAKASRHFAAREVAIDWPTRYVESNAAGYEG